MEEEAKMRKQHWRASCPGFQISQLNSNLVGNSKLRAAREEKGLKSLVGIRAIKALSNFYDRSVVLKQLERRR